MLVRLMAAESSVETAPDLGIFAKLLARYFQIRDDYMNLQSSDVRLLSPFFVQAY